MFFGITMAYPHAGRPEATSVFITPERAVTTELPACICANAEISHHIPRTSCGECICQSPVPGQISWHINALNELGALKKDEGGGRSTSYSLVAN